MERKRRSQRRSNAQLLPTIPCGLALRDVAAVAARAGGVPGCGLRGALGAVVDAVAGVPGGSVGPGLLGLHDGNVAVEIGDLGALAGVAERELVAVGVGGAGAAAAAEGGGAIEDRAGIGEGAEE